MKFCFAGNVYVSSKYGNRTINGASEFHTGLDLVGRDDTTVYAPCSGTILSSQIITDRSNRTWEWGNYIAVYSHEDNVVIYMCHLDARYVKAGDRVTIGQRIGKMGNTGYSFGAHTHFEIRKNNIAVNPCPYLGIPNYSGRTYNNTFDVEEDEMTGEEIYQKLTEYLASLPESNWSKNEGWFQKATEEGVMDGSNPRGIMTREQLAAVLGRKELL